MAKQLILILLAALPFFNRLPAQNDGALAQRIEAMKAAFITERLSLTPEESQQFWPLYNQYQKEEQQLRKRYQPDKAILNMSNQEASAHLNRLLEREQKLLDLKAQYLKRFQEVLPARKVALLPRVEEEFKRELLKRMQERRRRNNNRK